VALRYPGIVCPDGQGKVPLRRRNCQCWVNDTSSLFKTCIEWCGPHWSLPVQFIGAHGVVAIEKCLKSDAAVRALVKLILERCTWI
jgi:hypothetical protein